MSDEQNELVVDMIERRGEITLSFGEDADASVLVTVLNNRRDFEIARDQGWYRIPLKRAPRRVAADYLAFYQTQAFGGEGHAISYYAPVRRFHVASRAELLPSEPDHPRAAEPYYKIEIGPLQHLAQPIPSRRLRRITFIPTTLGRLLAAEEINDLWWRDDPQERLWLALREAGLQVEYRYQVGEPPNDSQIDFALFCQDGRIAILCDEAFPALLSHSLSPFVVVPSAAHTEDLRERRPADYALQAAGWHALRFSRHQLVDELAGCVDTTVGLVARLGGQ